MSFTTLDELQSDTIKQGFKVIFCDGIVHIVKYDVSCVGEWEVDSDSR